LVVLSDVVFWMHIIGDNWRVFLLLPHPIALSTWIWLLIRVLVKLRWICLAFGFAFFVQWGRHFFLLLILHVRYSVLPPLQLIGVFLLLIVVIDLLTLVHIMEMCVYILKDWRFDLSIIRMALHSLDVHLWPSLLRSLLRVTSWSLWLLLLLRQAKLVWRRLVWLVARLGIHYFLFCSN
jgi:hypothetical protein